MVRPEFPTHYVINWKVTYVTICFECNKTYDIKTERERKLKERLNKKICPNGKLVTFK